MTNKYEIQVRFNDTWYLLDTTDYSPISLQYQISDINEIDTRRASYSKTITLPMTKVNRKVFGDITNPAISSSVNPNLKAQCYILVNTIPVFQGSLQIVNSTYEDVMNNETIDVVVYSESDDFYKNLGEKYISDLYMDDLYHIYGTTSVVESWSGNANDLGYYYPFIDYGTDWTKSYIGPNGTSSVHYYDMMPAVYVKTIIDKMFREAGYTYNSNFFNSTTFGRFIIPFTKEKLEQVLSVPDYYFSAGRSSTYSYTGSSGLLDQRIKFNKTTSPYTDPLGAWDTTNYEWTNNGTFTWGNPPVTYNVSYKQRFKFHLEINVPTGVSSGGIYIWAYRSRNPITGATQEYPINLIGQPTGVVLNTSNATWKISAQFNPSGTLWIVDGFTDWLDGAPNTATAPIYPGEKVYFKVSSWLSRTGAGTLLELGDKSFVESDIKKDLYSNLYNETPGSGTDIELPVIVDMNKVLPDNVKQKDFMNSVIKMFNLYVEPDKIYPKQLNIEPRNDYYNAGPIEIWTDKLDLNSPIKEEILSNTQYRTILGTYKADKDFYNEDYTLNTNKIYGEYKEELENEFLSDEKKIEVTFSPTPLVNMTGYDKFIISKIGKRTNNVFSKYTSNIRFLMKPESGLLSLESESFKYEGVTRTTYPYAGHVDNPNDVNYDLNFGLIQNLYGWDTDWTNNNLFETYWKDQFDEFNDKDSKLVTCEMYLNPTDIYNFRFNKKIFIEIKGNGQYYRVLSITNYDPGQAKTSTVQLMKIKNITVPLVRKRPKIKKDSWRDTFSTNSIVSSTNVKDYGRNNLLLGENIQAFKDNNLISGNTSTSNGSGSVLVGDNSYVSDQTKAAMIIGDSNRIGLNTQNVTILGENNLVGTSQSQVGIDQQPTRSVMVVGEDNVVGLSVSNISVFGASNSVGENTKYIDIKGYNNFVPDGLINVQIIGNNQIATQSNTIVVDPTISNSSLQLVDIFTYQYPTLLNFTDSTAVTTEKMAGFGSNWTFTPKASKYRIVVTGKYTYLNTLRLRYGTGTAPSALAAATGTIITEIVPATQPNTIAFDVIFDLVSGTTYWFDISFAKQGTLTGQLLTSVSINIENVSGKANYGTKLLGPSGNYVSVETANQALIVAGNYSFNVTSTNFAQTTTYVNKETLSVSQTTTTATPVNTTANINIDLTNLNYVTARVMAYSATKSFCTTIECSARYYGGVITLVPLTSGSQNIYNDFAVSPAVQFVTATNQLYLQLTGVAATTIDWKIEYEIRKVV